MQANTPTDNKTKYLSLHSTEICWISTARYSQPLDPTTEKKWQLLTKQLGIHARIIGFSTTLRPRLFQEHAQFYLLPQMPSSILRYITFFLIVPFLLLWMVGRHGTRIFVAQSPYEGAVGAFIKRVCNLFGISIRLIVESHNDFEEVLFLQRALLFLSLYRKFMQASAQYAFRHADALRVISQATHNQVQQYASPHQPFVRFITWTDSEVFAEAQRQIPISGTIDIAYVGVLVPGKGVHYLLDAFAKIANQEANLYLIGKPENETYTQQLHEQAKTLHIADRVHFIGRVNQSELADYLGKMRVSVLPSLSEGLGRVVVEAMYLGTPVIASEVGGIPEMITDGENGYLVPPADVNALTEKLNLILADPNIEQLGENARIFANQFFSPQAYIDGYGKLFLLMKEADSE